jgi:hypothetical protein
VNSKNDIIEAIMSLNASATAEFLAEFSLAELSEYLQQLEAVVHRTATPRTRPSRTGSEAEPLPA